MGNVHTIYLIIVLIFSIYFYWFVAFKQTKSYYRAFDYLLMTLVGTVILGRIGGILLNWELFNDDIVLYPIFIQDSSNALHLSNNIPWVFLKVWDGKFDFLGLLYGPILTQIFVIKEVEYLKGWRKSTSLFISSGFVFYLFFKYYKFLGDNQMSIEEVLIVLLFALVSTSLVFLNSRGYRFNTNFHVLLLPIYILIEFILNIDKYNNLPLVYLLSILLINVLIIGNIVDFKIDKHK
jgi:hypothetical protein